MTGWRGRRSARRAEATGAAAGSSEAGSSKAGSSEAGSRGVGTTGAGASGASASGAGSSGAGASGAGASGAGASGAGTSEHRDPGRAARLRPMTLGDLPDVLALEHELFSDDPWSAEMFADEVAQPPDSRLYLVAETGTEPVLAGYAGMMFVPGGLQADVLTIAVRSACWGRGIGSALLGTILDEARRRGCVEVFLEVRADNPRAQGLYLRRGFEEIGLRRSYYQPSGVDAIVMRKDLLR
jgi:ribosomal-protein-alanine N-acetyltransferase